MFAVSTPAAAEPEVPPRCEAILSEARATASQLRLPHVEIRALHAPSTADVLGVGSFRDQARAGLAFQPLDLARGESLEAGARARCRQYVAELVVEPLLVRGVDFGRPSALQAELDTWQAGLPRLDAVVSRADERLARGLTTVLDVDDLHLRRLRVDARIAEVKLELATLGPEPVVPAAPLDTFVNDSETAALEAAREASFLRQLSAVRVDLAGGAIPWPSPEWYGMVTVSYGLGHLAQGPHEANALRATGEDLRTAADGLRARVTRFLDAHEASVVQLDAELAVLDRQLALVDTRLDAPADDAARTRDALAPLEFERLSLAARRAYVSRLSEARKSLRRNHA